MTDIENHDQPFVAKHPEKSRLPGAKGPRRALAGLPRPVAKALVQLGADIAIARKRRRMTVHDLARRVFTTRATIARIENGSPGVSVGILFSTLYILGLAHRIVELARPNEDVLGADLEIARLPKRVRLTKRGF